jgi:hypothetical protein
MRTFDLIIWLNWALSELHLQHLNFHVGNELMIATSNDGFCFAMKTAIRYEIWRED